MIIQGGSDFSEGSSANWIFVVKMEKLKTRFFVVVEKAKNNAWCRQRTLTYLLKPALFNFIFTFPELPFNDFLLSAH